MLVRTTVRYITFTLGCILFGCVISLHCIFINEWPVNITTISPAPIILLIAAISEAIRGRLGQSVPDDSETMNIKEGEDQDHHQ